MSKAVNEEVKKLVEKADSIKERFEQSLINAQAEASKLTEEIHQLEKDAKEAYSLYLMDSITLDSYEDATQELNEKKKKLTTAQSKINNIGEVQKEELAKVYDEYRQIQKDFTTERQKQYEDTKKQLQDAKDQYLQQIADISSKQYETYVLESKILDIGVEAGVNKRNYLNYSSPYFDRFGMEFGKGENSINIGNRELYWVYKKRNVNPTISI
ncbi:hypothetical protein [Gracilibacillus saliphilus]|uniref:hypothetical protein n=1 Tax=Gracilibacillus saliphilus TaxID=543890 RepID=UPI0013D2E8EC|nr:hypothetical protein [Gracilibacillus saliphilus]